MYSLLFSLSPSHSTLISSLLTFFSPHVISVLCHSQVWKWISHVVSLLPLPLHTFCLGQGVEHLVQYFTDTAWYSNTFFNMKSTCYPLSTPTSARWAVVWRKHALLHLWVCMLCVRFSVWLSFSSWSFVLLIGWEFGVTVKLFSL